MPIFFAACTVRFAASAPARCPSMVLSPRALAQRALPSIIMAIWEGVVFVSKEVDDIKECFFCSLYSEKQCKIKGGEVSVFKMPVFTH